MKIFGFIYIEIEDISFISVKIVHSHLIR